MQAAFAKSAEKSLPLVLQTMWGISRIDIERTLQEVIAVYFNLFSPVLSVCAIVCDGGACVKTGVH